MVAVIRMACLLSSVFWEVFYRSRSHILADMGREVPKSIHLIPSPFEENSPKFPEPDCKFKLANSPGLLSSDWCIFPAWVEV